MTEAEKKRFIEKSKKTLTGWFGLKHYDIRLRYRYEKENDGSISALVEYEQATININLEFNVTRLDLAKTILHEMVHIVNWRLYSVALDIAKQMNDRKFGKRMVVEANEAVTTAWTRILLPLLLSEE